MFVILVLGKNTYATNIRTAINNNYGKSGDSLTVSESSPSDLPIDPTGTSTVKGINSYRFFKGAFKNKLYAFQRTVDDAAPTDMTVWTSSNNGISWKKDATIKCDLDNATNENCVVMSTLIVDGKMVVIYGNKKHYITATSADGEKWDLGEKGDVSEWDEKRIIYYSGIPSDLSEDLAYKERHIICFESDKEPDQLKRENEKTIAACAVSDDVRTWKVEFYLRVKENVTGLSEIDQIYFFQTDIYFIANTTERSDMLFVCKSVSSKTKAGETVMLCEDSEEQDPEGNFVTVLNINFDKDSSTLVIKAPDAYVLGFLSKEHSAAENLLNIKSNRGTGKRDLTSVVTGPNVRGTKINPLTTDVDGDKPITFNVLYISQFVLSVMYEYEEAIFNISAELKQKQTTEKQGCEFVQQNKKGKEAGKSSDVTYTQTITYDDINSSSEKICPLNNFEPANNETDVIFFVKVPESVDFENSVKCFQHSYIEETADESSKHKRAVIKIKNVVKINDDPANPMKEIEFVYPDSLHNLMKYGSTISCISNNYNFRIDYTFPMDAEVIKTVRFETVVKDFTSEENRLSLKDYKWNDSVPSTIQGSYVVDSRNYMNRFQVYVDLLNNTPDAIKNYESFKETYPTEMNEYMRMPVAGEAMEQYAGIDFTNTSKHYELFDIDITADFTFIMHLIIPEQGKIVGLVCPVENSESLNTLHCFDEVADETNTRVSFEDFAKSFPFSISPKITLYNQKALGVESLLHLNSESYKALDKLTNAIQFQCYCNIKKHTVTVKFAIGTKNSIFPDETVDNEVTPGPGPEEDPDTTKTGGSTRNILSSFVVLLVLLNVFSSTIF